MVLRSASIRRRARRSLISWASTRRAKPRAWRRASEFFCHKVLQRRVVEHRVSQQPLQLGVLVLELLEPLGLGYIHAAELCFPGVERRRADPVLAADLGGRKPRRLLPQNPNDLFFREPRSP